tara:strand:- start:47 stop:1207 length:1161 start_codon:yes stop_codon:yes gene_type:complete
VANNPPRRIDIKGQDHMLAYITPEEGDVLQSLGGSGAPGPMGIPSFFDTGEGTGGYGGEGSAEGTTTDDYSDSGRGSFSDDAAAVANPVGIGHALGITPTNPFGYKGFFSKNFGINPKDIDYTNIYGGSVGGAQNAMNQIAGLNLGVTMNPNNVQGVIGFDPNQAPNQPRSGIQKGFGSLFGRPTGQITTLGPIAAQRSGKPVDALAQSIFGMIAKGTLPGLMSSLIGPQQSYAVKDSIGYNPSLDPALSGNQSLGTMADIASFGLTGGSSAQSKDAYDAITSLAPDMFNDVTNAVKDALSFNDTKGKAGTVDSTGTVNSVATGPTGTYSQPSVGIESLGLMGKDKTQDALDAVNNMFSPKGYSTVNTIGGMTQKEAEDIKSRLGY